jgi:hypothetical protein
VIDPFCKKVFKELGINVFMETGTDMGESVASVSCWFAEFDPDFGEISELTVTGARSYSPWSKAIQYPIFKNARESRYKVHSVDVMKECYENANKLFESNPNVCLYRASSDQFIRDWVEKVNSSDELRKNKYFFYLDAHWYKYWPLRDEIKEILKLDQFIIGIDDTMVPGKSDPRFPHGDFGYELNKGTPLNWAYMHDLFSERKVSVFYPNTSNRDRKGWLLIFSGYDESQLSFLEQNNMFRVGQDDPIHAEKKPVPFVAHLDPINIVKRLVPISLIRASVRNYQKLFPAS